MTPIEQYRLDRQRGIPRSIAMQRYYRSTVRARRTSGRSGSDWRTRGIGKTYDDVDIKRNIRILGFLGSRDISTGAKKEVISRSIQPYHKPDRVQKDIMKTVESKKVEQPFGSKYTIGAYRQYWSTQKERGEELSSTISPTGIYFVGNRPVRGFELLKRIRKGVIIPSSRALAESEKFDTSYSIARGYGGFEISTRQAEKGPSLQGFASFYLHYGDWAWKSLTGDTWEPGKPIENPQMREVRFSSLQSDIDAWNRGDVLYFGGAVLSHPVTLASLSMGTGALSEGLSFSGWGSKAFAGSPYITRGTAVKSFIGGAAGGYTAGMGARIYREQGIEGLREYVGKLAFYSPIAIGGYETGRSYGPKVAEFGGRLYDTYQKTYTGYVPKRIQTTFSTAKQHVVNPSDIAWWNRQMGKISYNLIPPNYRAGWFKTRLRLRMFKGGTGHKIHTASKIFAKDMSYYGTELYPYARKSGLVRDVGMFRPGELTIPYSGYGVSSGYLWPERDIKIMPRYSETSSQTFLTSKGVSRITRAIDNSFIGRYTYKPLESTGGIFESMGGGKKGGFIMRMKPFEPNKFWTEGDIFQKYYTSQEGPYGIIPSVRRYNISGFSISSEIPTPSGEIVGFKSFGSFHIGTDAFVGRPSGFTVFRPTMFTEGISYSRQFEGGFGIPGKYGFKTIDMPKMTLSYSYGKYWGIKGYGFTKDINLTLTPKPKLTPLWESFSIGTGDNLFVKSPDLLTLPGGIGASLSDKSLIELLKNPFSGLKDVSGGGRASIRTRTFWETPSYTSSYWEGISPRINKNIQSLIPVINVKPISMNINARGLINIPEVKTINIMDNIQEINRRQMPIIRIDTEQRSSLESMQRSLTRNITKTAQITQVMPRLQAIQITTPTTTTPTVTPPPPTPIIIPPPPILIPPPPPPPILFELKDDKNRKTKLLFDELVIGYRFRKWKTPSLKDFLKI